MPDPQSQAAANPFGRRSGTRTRFEQLLKAGFGISTYLVIFAACLIFGNILWRGLPVLLVGEAPFINTEFFTQSPETLVVFENAQGEVMRMANPEFLEYQKANPDGTYDNLSTHPFSGGGILGPLVGTLLLVTICMGVSLVVGIATAIYLSEFAKRSKWIDGLQLAIVNLAGVPSIVFGLFGLSLFCLSPWFPKLTYSPNQENIAELFGTPLLWQIPFTDGYLSFEGWGYSLIAGAFTLAVMVLPVIIISTQEALRAVPQGYREAAYALGADRWQCIRSAVLPYATPGILTASVLGVTRVAGETAPILFTAAVVSKAELPWRDAQGEGLFWLSDFLTQSVEALPYHIYTVALKVQRSEDTEAMQDGSILVFMLVVMAFAGISIFLRAKARAYLNR